MSQHPESYLNRCSLPAYQERIAHKGYLNKRRSYAPVSSVSIQRAIQKLKFTSIPKYQYPEGKPPVKDQELRESNLSK